MTDKLLPVAENVWLFLHDPDGSKVQPSVGVVCSATQTALIDAGNSPNHARRVLAALEKINAPPVTRILYTHHHWDHVYGASVFDARVVAHQLCQDILREEAAKPWSRDFVDEELQKNPQGQVSYTAMQNAIKDWQEFRVVVPEDTFAE
jgi:glyoxylase-like metal-dependent hydrolase (beta-lactamase superfamily II)